MMNKVRRASISVRKIWTIINFLCWIQTNNCIFLKLPLYMSFRSLNSKLRPKIDNFENSRWHCPHGRCKILENSHVVFLLFPNRKLWHTEGLMPILYTWGFKSFIQIQHWIQANSINNINQNSMMKLSIRKCVFFI